MFAASFATEKKKQKKKKKNKKKKEKEIDSYRQQGPLHGTILYRCQPS